MVQSCLLICYYVITEQQYVLTPLGWHLGTLPLEGKMLPGSGVRLRLELWCNAPRLIIINICVCHYRAAIRPDPAELAPGHLEGKMLLGLGLGWGWG